MIVHPAHRDPEAVDMRHFERNFALTNRLRTEGDRPPAVGRTGAHGLRDLVGIKRVRDHRHSTQLGKHRLL